MPVTILCVAAVLFIGYLIYNHVDKKKKIERMKLRSSALENKYKVLTYLDGKRGKQGYKMKIMEDLELGINTMKYCVKLLKAEKLIAEDANSIALTDFGKSFTTVYVKGVKKDGK